MTSEKNSGGHPAFRNISSQHLAVYHKVDKLCLNKGCTGEEIDGLTVAVT